MLAQNFMSHVDLAISETEQQALVKVLGMLEREEIKNSPKQVRKPIMPSGPPTMFNMNFVHVEADCGTVACILGWARYVIGDDDIFLRVSSGNEAAPIFKLFFPHGPGINANASQAAAALRSYLTIGEPNWTEAVG